MEFVRGFILFVTLVGLANSQDYSLQEASDTSVKREFVIVLGPSTSRNIKLNCSVTVTDVKTKYINGDFVVSWNKEQNETEEALNKGGIISEELPSSMQEHLDYNQNVEGDNMLKTYLTIKAFRPEDSGKYMCRLQLKGQTHPVSEVTYTITIIDPAQFKVMLHGNSNPHMVPQMPNITTWAEINQIELKQHMAGSMQSGQYAYLACAAESTSTSPLISVSLENPEYPERNRNLHGRMKSIIVKEYIGTVPFAKKLMVSHVLEDRMFPVNAEDDGAKINCTARIEDGDGKVLLSKETMATLNLLTKPQFVNCSKEVYSPMGAQNFIISCEIKAKPMLTGDVMWSVQPPNSNEFQVQDGSYGYTKDLIGQPNNIYLAKLTITEVTEQEHLRSIFKITAQNSVGSSEFRILLLEGENPNPQQTGSANIHQVFALLLLSALAAILIQ